MQLRIPNYYCAYGVKSKSCVDFLYVKKKHNPAIPFKPDGRSQEIHENLPQSARAFLLVRHKKGHSGRYKYSSKLSVVKVGSY